MATYGERFQIMPVYTHSKAEGYHQTGYYLIDTHHRNEIMQEFSGFAALEAFKAAEGANDAAQEEDERENRVHQEGERVRPDEFS